MTIKKIAFILIISFGFVLNLFSTDRYTLDSVSVKITNPEMASHTQINGWQPYQKVDGYILINGKKKEIIFILKDTITYKFNKKEYYDYCENVKITYYKTKDMLFSFELYKVNKDTMFYIKDVENKIEVNYKIKK